MLIWWYMKKYLIEYYSDKVQQEILALPKTLMAKYFQITDIMVDDGSNLGEPYTKSLSGGLFELRLKGSEGIARVFFCTLIGKRIIMLHSFIKKTQKTPIAELNTAKKRMKEVQNEKC